MITSSEHWREMEGQRIVREPWHGGRGFRANAEAGDNRNCAPSRAEQFAIDAVRRNEILSRLLDPISPAAWGGRQVLWPLWADEMLHRTYVMVQLAASLIARSPSRDESLIACQLESAVARNLAVGLRELMVVHDNHYVPCSAGLRSATRNLVELFGPSAGLVTVGTSIEPLQLPEYKRRALVLLAVDLVSNALLHGFHRQAFGHIEVMLHPVTPACTRLVVKHNGEAVPAVFPQACHRISRDLADLLEGELIDGAEGIAGIATEVVFPM
jgi:two-component sensor histidine kinase